MGNFKSFIKKLKPVTCYKNPNLSFDDRFRNPEKKGWQWKKGFEDWKDSAPSFKNWLQWYTKGYAFTKIEVWREELYNLIYLFTLKDCSDKEFDKYTQVLLNKRHKYVKQVKRNKRDELWVTLKNGEKSHFITLSSYYLDLEKFMPEILTNDRDRECHYLSRKLAIQHYIEGKDASVVTGIVNRMSPKYKYLHSWVLVNNEAGEFVIDPTLNVIANCDTYNKLLDVKKLESIDCKTLYDEQDIYADLISIDGAYSKLYLCSHNEAICKWKELGLDKLSDDERYRFREENKYRRAKEKINQSLKNNNNIESTEQGNEV